MNKVTERAYYYAAKEYNALCDEHVVPASEMLEQRSFFKTSCMEKQGLDPREDRKLLMVLSIGIRNGGNDFDNAAVIGYTAYNKLLERFKERENKGWEYEKHQGI